MDRKKNEFLPGARVRYNGQEWNILMRNHSQDTEGNETVDYTLIGSGCAFHIDGSELEEVEDAE